MIEKKTGINSSSIKEEASSFIWNKTLFSALGGNKIRINKNGNLCQGWVKDYYSNRQLLHEGYYVDGQLKIFINYFENGSAERILKLKGYKKSTKEVFHVDGKPKSIIKFYKGNPRKWSEFYYPQNEPIEIYVKNK